MPIDFRSLLRRGAIALVVPFSLAAACRESVAPAAPTGNTEPPLQYLALGDSYTIGESVPQSESFPYQLADALQQEAGLRVSPTVIARTGWRSDVLLDAIERENPSAGQDLVTVLIGVNDQYQGRSVESFRQNLRLLLDRAEALAEDGVGDVLVVTIPDYSATPFAAGTDTTAIRQALDRFNAVVLAEAEARGIPTVDITPGSKLARSNRDLIAGDGLHPSGLLYAEWVKQILPVALAQVRD